MEDKGGTMQRQIYQGKLAFRTSGTGRILGRTLLNEIREFV